MNIKAFLFAFLFIFMGVVGISAQTIIDELEQKDSAFEGKVSVEEDQAITRLLGKPASEVTSGADNVEYLKMNGFRIQVFMGNNPKKSREEAESKQAMIKEGTEITTYLEYNPPNWKLLAGDFLTREEATIFKQQLEKLFPQFGKEMYIVASEIKIPIQKAD